MERKRILGISDGVTPTGFARVAHSIFERLPKEEFEVNHLAVNYYGDPHDESWKIYPAALGGDLWGFNRVKLFADKDIKLIWILNDPWVIDTYLSKIKEVFEKNIPPIIVYFPVDAKDLSKKWFKHYEIVKSINVYTKFAYGEIEKLRMGLEEITDIVPHGVDPNLFYPIKGTKEEKKKLVYPERADYIDSFIVLNANRNQPRKRIDLTMEGFKLFSEGKPENVKLYLHMGTEDVGCNILDLSEKLKISDRLILTSLEKSVQKVPIERLNQIYNATDVGINTSLGEGWSLTNIEHANTGAPQVVADHSALHELYEDIGLLIPIRQELRNLDALTVGGLVRAEDVADKLESLYVETDLYNTLSNVSIQKFKDPYYSWDRIVEEQWIPKFREF